MKKYFISSLMLAALLITSCSSDDDTTNSENGNTDGSVIQAVVAPEVGGPNQPNQVYINLSDNSHSVVSRDSWDFGFYTGNDFRVILNGSIEMAAKQTTTNDISIVQTEDASVSVGYSTLASSGYVDNPTGVLQGNGGGEGTAISEISEIDADNMVYIVNMGYEISTETPNTGTVITRGNHRGWKKIRITRQGDDYVIQYADLDATSAASITVSKDTSFNFTFLDLESGSTVAAQPEKEDWDICFTGFTNYADFGPSPVLYYFSDFVTSNRLGGTKVYEVIATDIALTESEFEAFSFAQVDDTQFNVSTTDQRIIGSNWRNGGGPSSQPSVKDDRFYIVKDVDGNYYKILFLAMYNDANERGYPVFEYRLLE